MQVPYQGRGLIEEHEGRIKQCVISNLAISLDHQISSIQRSMTMVDPPTIAQLQLWRLGDKLKPHASYGSSIHTDFRWSPTNRYTVSINFNTKAEGPKS
jgi:hypothetical protein